MFVESVMKWMERKVDQDVMDEDIGETWIEVKRRPRTRGTKACQRRSENFDRWFRSSSRCTGRKTFLLMVSPSDKVDDVMKRIRNNEMSSRSDVYMTCEGRVLRWIGELRSSGVSDGCTVQIPNKMRCGGKR